MMLRRLASLLVAGLVVAAQAAPAQVVRHGMWDANQRPLYQACARQFEAAHPGVRIRLEQIGWDDYWTSLSTGFISNTAPDVFTNHLAKFSEFVVNGVVVDLAPFIARDRVDTGIYEDGLMSVWQREGRQYALPTDWDTVAVLVNLDIAQRTGVGIDDFRRMDWNPRDGGSFGRIAARLTRDEAGRRPGQPGFDRQRVRHFGFQLPGGGGMMGQTQWSSFAVANGFRYQDAPWSPDLRFDDPAFIETIDYFARLPATGAMATPEQMGRLGAVAMFMAGRVGMIVEGSWMSDHFRRTLKFPYAWVPTPIGPIGRRASMRNGLALSIWSGSRVKEAAWQWVRHVGSPPCQRLLAESGILYPAMKGMAEVSLAVQRQRGTDTGVFLEAARGFTFAPPIAPRAAEITDLMESTTERILAGRARAAQALPETARRVREVARQP